MSIRIIFEKVFWNPQDKQISTLSLNLYLDQHLKEILRFFTAAGAVCHHCILSSSMSKLLLYLLCSKSGISDYREVTAPTYRVSQKKLVLRISAFYDFYYLLFYYLIQFR